LLLFLIASYCCYYDLNAKKAWLRVCVFWSKMLVRWVFTPKLGFYKNPTTNWIQLHLARKCLYVTF